MLPSQSINMKRQDSVRGENSAATLVLLINNANTSLDGNDFEDTTRSLDAAVHLRIIYARAPFGVGKFFHAFSYNSFVDMGARSAEKFFLSIPFICHPFSYTLLNKIYLFTNTPLNLHAFSYEILWVEKIRSRPRGNSLCRETPDLGQAHLFV